MSNSPLYSNVEFWHRWKHPNGVELLICPDCWDEVGGHPCHKETTRSEHNCKNVACEIRADGRFGKVVGQCMCYGDFHGMDFEKPKVTKP